MLLHIKWSQLGCPLSDSLWRFSRPVSLREDPRSDPELTGVLRQKNSPQGFAQIFWVVFHLNNYFVGAVSDTVLINHTSGLV